METIEQADETATFVFGREREREELRRRFSARKSFVLYGTSGAGKTFLVRRVMRDFPEMLYCSNSHNPQSVFQSLALALMGTGNRTVRSSLGNGGGVKAKSTISLRGIVLDAVRRGIYWVVLDHLRGPAAGLSSDIRDLMLYGGTPVLAVARSEHMEDLGFLMPMFALRAERMRLSNFGRSDATQFAEELARRFQLGATNLPEFLERIVDLSQGAAGPIQRMIQMALYPKYRLDDYIKTSPLCIDFRLAWHAENAW
jgi:hypothetical protein